VGKIHVFEATRVTAQGQEIVIVRVPDDVPGDPMKLGVVMARAMHDLKSRAVLAMGRDSGRIVGNHDHKRLVQGFDPEQALWFQWNMEE
jgi:hypothetical protein